MYKILANTLILGKRVIFLPSCHSTNTEAEKLLADGPVTNGTIIITDDQNKGKGQLNNNWESEPGKNLTFSVIINNQGNKLPLHKQFYLNIITTLALHDAIADEVPTLDFLKIKWPNDVYYQDKKICGILIKNLISQGAIEHSIIGIGLNINQAKFNNDKASSLAEIVGREISLKKTFNSLIARLDHYYNDLIHQNYTGLKEAYESKLFWKGATHIFNNGSDFEGRIIGIDPMGKLLIETKSGINAFNNKEVAFKM